jgi:cellulose synthase/poly-beta-1,6-N-acetylglucosamine synthase-like glycosyltransferase
VISNPDAGWFPALTWAMFLIDNRFQNRGRSNLGWSAKNMGDSICFRRDVLQKTGWGEGLTEDYELRQRLLLEGIRIAYEPRAVGYGEAPRTWEQARAQRTRWLTGTRDANKQYAKTLLSEGFKRRDVALLDGVFQAYLPSYSTLTMLGIGAIIVQVLMNLFIGPIISMNLIGSWMVVVVLLFSYPFLGLALERAPLKAYLAILSGPFFILWRTWLVFKVHLMKKPPTWVRTVHGEDQ